MASEANLRAAQIHPGRSAWRCTNPTPASSSGCATTGWSTRKTNFEAQDPPRGARATAKTGAEAAKVWDEVAAAYKKWTPSEKSYQILEGFAAPGSRLFRMARQIVRGEALEQSDDPVNDEMETLMLTQYLVELVSLGEKEVSLKTILAGATPKQAAEKMVKASHLKDAAERRRLAANREAALRSGDGIIALAAALEAPAAASAQTARGDHRDARSHRHREDRAVPAEALRRRGLPGWHVDAARRIRNSQGVRGPRRRDAALRLHLQRPVLPQGQRGALAGCRIDGST